VGLAPDQLSSRHGIGLANTEARLQALHGAAAKLELHTPPEGGLRVEITLPYRTAITPGTASGQAAANA
jgi:sensor histidine kinase YesM